jgi:hypothetical protein
LKIDFHPRRSHGALQVKGRRRRMTEAENSDDPRAAVLEVHHVTGNALLKETAVVLKRLDGLPMSPEVETGALERLARVASIGARMQLDAYEHWDEYQRSKGAVTAEDQMDVAAALAESRHSGAIPEGATLAGAVEAVLGAYDAEVEKLAGELETAREQRD